MTDYAQRASNSFNERMRLIRFRRKREKLRFWDEFKLVPRWLVAVVVLLFILAQVIAYIVNTQGLTNNGEIFPPELRNNPTLASLALAGIITSVALVLGASLFLFGYVNRDAKRRGMNSTLWTLLVILLFPAYFALGFIIYFLMREPLPYPCPQCGNTVGARFNFCPNCKCNLYPACPQCKREVVETDKFCPYCGNDLKAAASTEPAVQSPT
jgi:ABC-type Fe3+ transport system permease subunit/RNA polymerase subunit RPABC4/transcription elongation factor Spt4